MRSYLRSVFVSLVPILYMATGGGCATDPDPVAASSHVVIQGLSVDGMEPADLLTAYGITPSATVTTVSVTIPFHHPALESELATFRAAYGLPPCTVANGKLKVLNQNGIQGSYPGLDPSGSPQWDDTIMADLDILSAMYPAAKLVVVESNDDLQSNLIPAVDTASHTTGVRIALHDWSLPEAGTASLAPHFSVAGVGQIAPTGDQLGIARFPASVPSVFAVGAESRSLVGGVWTHNAIQQFGACSAVFGMPAYQTAKVGALCPSGRATPDVSAMGDATTGVRIFSRGSFRRATGTAVSAAIIASIAAQAGHPVQPSTLYTSTSGIVDVTTGPSALPGFDFGTGLGSTFGLGAF